MSCRIISKSTSTITIPVAVFFIGMIRGKVDIPLQVLADIVAVLGIWRHRLNIARLRAGTENKMVKKPKDQTDS